MSRSDRGSSSKRQRWNADDATTRKKHLYLALDDWKDGCSVHKLDADNMEPSGHLTEPSGHLTEPAALTLGPRVPDGLFDLGGAMAVGERLYAVTTVCRQPPSLKVLTMAPNTKLEPWNLTMDWFWNSLPTSTSFNGDDIMSPTHCIRTDTPSSCPRSTIPTPLTPAPAMVCGRSMGIGCCPSEAKPTLTPTSMGGLGFTTRRMDIYAAAQLPPAAAPPLHVSSAGCSKRSYSVARKRRTKPGHSHLKPTLTYMVTADIASWRASCKVSIFMRDPCSTSPCLASSMIIEENCKLRFANK